MITCQASAGNTTGKRYRRATPSPRSSPNLARIWSASSAIAKSPRRTEKYGTFLGTSGWRNSGTARVISAAMSSNDLPDSTPASKIACASLSRAAAAVSTLIPARIFPPIAKRVGASPMRVGTAAFCPLTLCNSFIRNLL